MQSIHWTRDQENAIRAMRDFMADPYRQLFKLNGYAGTGKTTLITQVVPELARNVEYVTLTGKAADVLRSKGAGGAGTLHSKLYQPTGETVWCLTCEKEDPGCDHLSWVLRPQFDLAQDGPLGTADLVVVDEASMIGRDTADDLLALARKVIVTGDDAQLPSIEGNGYLLEGIPDATLNEITRTAAESPLTRLAHHVRLNGTLPPTGDYGDGERGVTIRHARELGHEPFDGTSQVIVGTHVTRQKYNGITRRNLGRASTYPVIGDRLICRRNDRDAGFFNGQQLTCAADARLVGTTQISLAAAGIGTDSTWAGNAWAFHFTDPKSNDRARQMPYATRSLASEFAYGYAVTAHSAQGSEWDDVHVVEESRAFARNPETPARWLYTAVTRARKNLVVAL